MTQTKLLTDKEVAALLLPKWPQMRVWGESVPPETAKEIILRTDTFLTSRSEYAGGNNRTWNKWALTTLGRWPLTQEDSPYTRQARDRIFEELDRYQGNLRTEYVQNEWASCLAIGGPHGWCKPSGELSYADNVGKWPSAEELLADWTSLAKAFPCLTLTATFMSGEDCEDNIVPVFSIQVKAGTAVAVSPITPPDANVTAPRDLVAAYLTGSAPREQGIPDTWVKELGVRSRAALAHIIPKVLAELQASPVN